MTLTLAEAVANVCTFTNTLCSAGTFDNGTICKAADPGHHVAGSGSTAQTACTPGYYQPLSGQASCLAADPGYYVPGSAATAQQQCPAGTTSGPAASVCTPTTGTGAKVYLPMAIRGK